MRDFTTRTLTMAHCQRSIALFVMLLGGRAHAQDLAQPLPSPELGTGEVTVKVIGKKGISDAKTGITVSLTPAKGETLRIKTGANGRALFSKLVPKTQYVASIQEKGAIARSVNFTIPPSGGIRLLLTLPQATKTAGTSAPAPHGGSTAPAARPVVASGPPSLRFGRGTHVLAQVGENGLAIMHTMTLENPGGGLFRPPVRGLAIPLPRGARNVRISPQSKKLGSLNKAKNAVMLMAPVAPGSTTLQVSYDLLTKDGHISFSQAMPLPSAPSMFAVTNQEVLTLYGPSFERQETREHSGSRFMLAHLRALPQGGKLEFEISGLPARDTRPIWGLFGVSALVLIWAIFAGRSAARRLAGKDRQKRALVDELAALELENKAGNLDEASYVARQRDTRLRLKELWD